MRGRMTASLLLGAGRGGRRAAGALEAVTAAELLGELVHATGGVDELLLSGEERVTGRADVDVDLRRRAAGHKRVAAGTVHGTGLVLRMNFAFHGRLSLVRTCVIGKTHESRQ